MPVAVEVQNDLRQRHTLHLVICDSKGQFKTEVEEFEDFARALDLETSRLLPLPFWHDWNDD